MKHLEWALVALLSLLAPGMTSEAGPLRVTEGLVGEWRQPTLRFFPPSDLVYDTSGLNQTGRVYPDRAYSYGWQGLGMDLTGRYIQVRNSPNLNFGTKSFTLSAWIRMTDTRRELKTLIDNRGTDGRGYAFAVSGGSTLLLQLSDETGVFHYTSKGPRTLVPNRWHHVAVSVNRTFRPTGIAFYIDGLPAGAASPGMGNIDNTDLPFYIGGHEDAALGRFNDRVDEVFVYNRALPPGEIGDVMNPGRPVFTPAYWKNSERLTTNNCYNYANNKATNTFAQPGIASGTASWVMDCAVVRQSAISDGLEPIPFYPRNSVGFKTGAALVVAPGLDYHWYRLDENGLWTHKPGQTAATRLDNSGNVITDPRLADRGPYTQFCGFFLVWTDREEGAGHENIQ